MYVNECFVLPPPPPPLFPHKKAYDRLNVSLFATKNRGQKVFEIVELKGNPRTFFTEQNCRVKKWDRLRKRPIWLKLIPALQFSKQIPRLFIRVHLFLC